MSDFEQAIKAILKHEGGWVDDPDDPGGETNFGISMLIIRREGITPAQCGVKDFSPGALKRMPVSAAKDIYRKLFWDKYGYSKIEDQTVATKVFDCGVNCGPSRSHAMIQKAVNTIDAEALTPLTVDGILGPATLAAINSIEPAMLVQNMADEMRAYYLSIIAKKPRLAKFKNNWLKRAKWGVA